MSLWTPDVMESPWAQGPLPCGRGSESQCARGLFIFPAKFCGGDLELFLRGPLVGRPTIRGDVELGRVIQPAPLHTF